MRVGKELHYWNEGFWVGKCLEEGSFWSGVEGLVIIVGEGGCDEVVRLRVQSGEVVLAGLRSGLAIGFRMRMGESCHY